MMNPTLVGGKAWGYARRSWGLHRSLYRLDREQDRTARAMSTAVRDTMRHRLTAEERDWIDRIELLRAELNASTRRITHTDHGAGDRASPRKARDVAGIEVVDTLARFSKASSPPFWCLLLFKIIRMLRPTSCIEMGTAVGISAAYQAAALKLNGDGGVLTTLEGGAPLADVARNNLCHLGLESVDVVVGRFQDTLDQVLTVRRPVDYVFIDGHHDEQATRTYFEQLLPFLSDTAVLVFDDIAWSEGMRRAWGVIARDPRATLAVDLGTVGISIISRSGNSRSFGP